ncbi:MAG: hypothetical protein AAGD04_10005 [Pseudomonadota bacterium]
MLPMALLSLTMMGLVMGGLGGGDSSDIGASDPDTSSGTETDTTENTSSSSTSILNYANANPDDDTVQGTDSAHTIDLGAGNDTLASQGGNDNAKGGTGNDVIFGGNGDDVIYGNDGDDVLIGGTGNDTLRAGSGNDILSGINILADNTSAEDLATLGTSTQAFVDPLSGADTSGADILKADEGDDFLMIGGGDTATGGAGSDMFFTLEGIMDGTAPGIITDFDKSEDALVVGYESADGEPDIEITNMNGDALVAVNGLATYLVQGAGALLSIADIYLLATDA